MPFATLQSHAEEETRIDRARGVVAVEPPVEPKAKPSVAEDIIEAPAPGQAEKEAIVAQLNEAIDVISDEIQKIEDGIEGLEEKAMDNVEKDDPGVFAGRPLKVEPDASASTLFAPGAVNATISRIDAEQFQRMLEDEKNPGVQNGPEQMPDTSPSDSWMRKPEPWPSFMTFPNPRDLRAIQQAEAAGELDDEAKERFNQHFREMSELMVKRAEQINRWIHDENKNFPTENWKVMPFFKSVARRDLNRIEKIEEKAQLKSSDANLDTGVSADPFCNIKWAILLDPYANPKDPRFAAVARWGHGVAVTHDGGRLISDEKGIHAVAGGRDSKEAGILAVTEAFERGWTHVDISGDAEFIKGAKEAVEKYGMGAVLTTQIALIGGRREFIMPDIPKLESVRTMDDVKDQAHRELMGDMGKIDSDPEIDENPGEDDFDVNDLFIKDDDVNDLFIKDDDPIEDAAPEQVMKNPELQEDTPGIQMTNRVIQISDEQLEAEIASVNVEGPFRVPDDERVFIEEPNHDPEADEDDGLSPQNG